MRGECILALDQAPGMTGWALCADAAGLTSGAWPLGKTSQRGLLYRELWRRLDAVHHDHALERIIHERPNFGMANKGEAQLLATTGLIATIELWGCSRGIAVQGYSSGAWRGTFFTKTERKDIRARKDWKRAAVIRCRQLGLDPGSDDEAEAIALLDHHHLSNQIQPEWRLGQQALEAPIG